jgi:hypothetical protein
MDHLILVEAHRCLEKLLSQDPYGFNLQFSSGFSSYHVIKRAAVRQRKNNIHAIVVSLVHPAISKMMWTPLVIIDH